jgi:uncharacterized membrane protein
MNTQQPTRRNGAASTALMIFGGTIMVIALIWFIYLYIWRGQQLANLGGGFGDLIANMYMICGALPAFVLGLILLLIGWSAKGKSKAAQRDPDTAKPPITQ